MSSSNSSKVVDVLREFDVTYALSIPCKYLDPLIRALEQTPEISLLTPSREEEGIGITAGFHMAGKRSVFLMQNSGLGNSVNAFSSLHRYYQIPACFFISMRGDDLEKVPAQKPMGSITEDLLRMLEIKTYELREAGDIERVNEGLQYFIEQRKSVAFLVRKPFFEGA